MEWLQGKKTYLASIAIAVTAALHASGVIPQEWVDVVWAVLGALGLAGLRAGMGTPHQQNGATPPHKSGF